MKLKIIMRIGLRVVINSGYRKLGEFRFSRLPQSIDENRRQGMGISFY